MASSLHAFCLLLISHLVTAQWAVQSAEPSAATSTYVDISASDLGILQLVTPTTHANQVAATALYDLTIDALSFYTAYTEDDPFNYVADVVLAIETQPLAAQHTLVANEVSLNILYFDAYTSLLSNPTSYLSRLHAAASPYPSAFSSSLLSQATGILLGYESLVSQDVLSTNPSSGPITPGMSIAVGPAITNAPGASEQIASAQASQGTSLAASTSSSKAAGVPVVTASPLLMVNAAAAAVGVLGMALM